MSEWQPFLYAGGRVYGEICASRDSVDRRSIEVLRSRFERMSCVVYRGRQFVEASQ